MGHLLKRSKDRIYVYSGAKNFQQKKSNPLQKFSPKNLDFERGRISLIKISPRFQNQYHNPGGGEGGRM